MTESGGFCVSQRIMNFMDNACECFALLTLFVREPHGYARTGLALEISTMHYLSDQMSHRRCTCSWSNAPHRQSMYRSA